MHGGGNAGNRGRTIGGGVFIMSNRIRETLYAQTANDGSTIYVVANIDCDTAADLPAVNAFTGLTLLMGSRAHDIDQNAWYEMQDGGTWILQDAGTAAYTKAEVDTLLAGKEDVLTWDTAPTSGSTNPVTSGGLYSYIYGLPTINIPAGADLNTAAYIVPGAYCCQTNAIAATLTNCPTANGFKMFVYDTIALTGYQQRIIFPNNANGEFFWQRRTTALNFSSWFQFQGTAV